VRQQLTLALERMGMACESVASAAAALARLAESHVDLVLVDVVMPDMDGYKLTREIKRNKLLRQIPVIILTSKSSPFDLARGALAGCDTYLTKPVPLKALESAVVKQLRKALAIDDLSAMLRTPDAPAGPTGPVRSGLLQGLVSRQGGR
jgi:twitching motility two-component system response regulator PilG